MDVKSLIQGTLSSSKDDLWVAVLYSPGEGDSALLRTQSQNIPECHIRDDSEFSRPNVGRLC